MKPQYHPHRKAFRKLVNEEKPVEMPAFLGSLSGVVPFDNNSNVYVVLSNGQELAPVRNVRVPNIPRLPVNIGFSHPGSNLLEVLSFRNTYVKLPYPNIPSHADATHTWPGYDTLWVRGEQILPGLVVPAGGLTVSITGYVVFLNGWDLLMDQTIDFTTSAVSSGALMCLVEVDENQLISMSFGTLKSNVALLSYSDIPIPTVGKKPLFAVRLYEGQTEFVKNAYTTDIIDLRWTGFASGAGSALSVLWEDIIGSTAGVEAVIDGMALEGDGYRFGAGGRLAVVNSIDSPLIVGRSTAIYQWWVYLENTGTAGSTIIDILKNGVSVFTNPLNRPEVAFDDVDGKVLSVVADIIDYVPGDLITCDIVQISTGAENLSVVGSVLIPVTVTSGSQSKVEGDPDPVLSYSSSLPITFTGAITREAGETAGSYATLVGTLTAPVGYTLIFISDFFTIAGELTVSAVTVIDTFGANPASNIIDGNDTTQWVSNTKKPNGVWFKLDFGAGHYVFHRIRFLQAVGLAGATSFKVETCNDVAPIDEFWTSLGTVTSIEIVVGEYTFNGVGGVGAGRYIKFTCLDGDPGSGWEVFDATVHGV